MDNPLQGTTSWNITANAIEREPDIKVTFDQFDLWAGKDLTHFMERGMKCERIVVVSTSEYLRKAEERKGGTGYECSLITAELARDMSQDKFIPTMREGSAVPSFLGSKLYVDFRDPKEYETALGRLLAAIRRQPTATRPPKRGMPATTGAPIYTHEPPAPRRLLPGRAQFGLIWGSGGVSVTAKNEGDHPSYSVRVRVEFEGVPSFEIDFGDLAPYDRQKEVDVMTAARQQNIDAHPIIIHVEAVHSGLVEPNPENRFLFLSKDENDADRAEAFLLGYDPRRKSLTLQRAPVTVTYPKA
jgi:hypothetical protein